MPQQSQSRSDLKKLSTKELRKLFTYYRTTYTSKYHALGNNPAAVAVFEELHERFCQCGEYCEDF